MSSTEPKIEHIRRNSLRLQGFDYSTRCSYFVTIVAHERRRFFDDPQIAEATINCLLELREKRQFNLYQYCLMPDHLHALIGIGDSGLSLSAICGAFKSLSTRAFWQCGGVKLWQRQFFDHIIRNENEFLEVVEYIRLNPVRKGLVEHWREWRFSGEPDL